MIIIALAWVGGVTLTLLAIIGLVVVVKAIGKITW